MATFVVFNPTIAEAEGFEKTSKTVAMFAGTKLVYDRAQWVLKCSELPSDLGDDLLEHVKRISHREHRVFRLGREAGKYLHGSALATVQRIPDRDGVYDIDVRGPDLEDIRTALSIVHDGDASPAVSYDEHPWYEQERLLANQVADQARLLRDYDYEQKRHVARIRELEVKLNAAQKALGIYKEFLRRLLCWSTEGVLGNLWRSDDKRFVEKQINTVNGLYQDHFKAGQQPA